MTHKDYMDRKKQIYLIAVREIRYLDREFASENIYFLTEKGDIITDCLGSIKVLKVVALHGGGSDYPCAKFYGYVLKKNNEPRKDKRCRWVYSYLGS